MPPPLPSDPPAPLIGSLRDAVATANALLLLLRSRNVAPKAIAQLLPSLQDTFSTTAVQFQELAAALGGPLPGSFTNLGQLLAAQGARFDTAIDQGTRGAITARTRLHLEHAISLVCHDLSATLALLELWSDALLPPANVDLVELLTLSRAGDQPPIPNSESVHVKLLVETAELPLVAPPRAVLNLLALGTAVVAAGGDGAQLSLRLVRQGERCAVELGSADVSARHFLALQLPALLPESASTLLDAAARFCLTGYQSEAGLRFNWVANTPDAAGF